MKKYNKQTKTTKNDLENRAAVEKNRISRIAGTVLIILSGIILYTDKIFDFYNFEIENLHGWKTSEVFVWTLCQTISPVIIMLAMYLRPYFIALIIPLFCYCLQYFFVMDSALNNDNPLTWIYTTFSSVALLYIIYVVKKQIKKIDEIRNLKLDMLEQLYESHKNK